MRSLFYPKTLQDYRGSFFSKISKRIDDEQFKSRNTDGSKGFTRKRRLTFKNLIILISRLMVSSIQRELNEFFSRVQELDYDIHSVTKGALTQARKNLVPEAFLELNQMGVETFYEGAPYQIWKKHRLLAIDGSTIKIPNHATTRDTFGVMKMGCKSSAERVMARVSICYDVLNLVTLDAKIDRFDVSEQKLMRDHLEAVAFKDGDIVIADRGYPSIALMYNLQRKGVGFCLRMKAEWWKEVEKFNASGLSSKEVYFELPAKDKCLQEHWDCVESGVRCRLVAVELPGGQKEILCTSLMDEQEYTVADMKELYHYRWNVEEAYKLLKVRAGLEHFSGKTAHAVKQDFYATIFMMNTCAIISFPIEQKVRQEAQKASRKHSQQINRTNILAFFKKAWVAIWIRNKGKQVLKDLEHTLTKSTDIVRPDRSYERKKEHKKSPPMNYKQL